MTILLDSLYGNLKPGKGALVFGGRIWPLQRAGSPENRVKTVGPKIEMQSGEKTLLKNFKKKF